MSTIISCTSGPAVGAPFVPVRSVQYLSVDEQAQGQRLDNFLIRHLKGVPKSHIYRLIRSGQVRVNAKRVSAQDRLLAGDAVRVPPLRLAQPASEPLGPLAPAREFPIVFEDESLLVIDKPAGVAVHGGSGVAFGVIEQLRRARPQARFLELAHRLDRETSGALIIAKKGSALKDIQRQLRQRLVGKTYLAVTLGSWPQEVKVIDAPLERFLVLDAQGQSQRRVRLAEPGAQGHRALTIVQVLERQPQWTVLSVTIKTGRTHQIRVHTASVGHPIAGDEKYGDFARNKALASQGLRRMALHAWRVRLTHPASGETLELTAPVPPELLAFCGQWVRT